MAKTQRIQDNFGAIVHFFTYHNLQINLECLAEASSINSCNKPAVINLTIIIMHTYFISDLHLSSERPNTVAAFMHFMQNQAQTADALYILGDLFEFWIGDDAVPLIGAEPVIQQMHATAQQLPCYFIAGNRDFLVGDAFERMTGFTIIDDETVIDLYGTPTLLLHGDSLCTDDTEHQAFRQQYMTNKAFHQQFMQLTIEQRIEQAKLARMESAKHKDSITMGIMDVNEQAVLDSFTKHSVTQMIHGHTHRQNTHEYEGDLTRYVLGEWHTTASLLSADSNGLTLANFPI